AAETLKRSFQPEALPRLEALAREGVPCGRALGLRDMRRPWAVVAMEPEVRARLQRGPGSSSRLAILCGATAKLSDAHLASSTSRHAKRPKASALRWCLDADGAAESSSCICVNLGVSREEEAPPAKKLKGAPGSDAAVRLRHILLRHPQLRQADPMARREGSCRSAQEAEEAALNVLERLLKTQSQFPQICRELSDCQTAEQPGALSGDLGWVSRGQQEPAVEDAAFSLKANEFSDLVVSSRGVHIFQRRALAGTSQEAPAAPSLVSESQPQVVVDRGGDLLIAWKPAKVSTRRLRGGLPSQLEQWAAHEVAGARAEEPPAVAPRLGRGVAGLVFLARTGAALREAEAALATGAAEASVTAVVQGRPPQGGLGAESGGRALEVALLRSSEGLHLGRLSIVRAALRGGGSVPDEKEVRRRLAALGHPVIGNGQLCARSAGVNRTHLVVSGLALGGLEAHLPPPASFGRLLDTDAARLQRRTDEGGEWAGRTEHHGAEGEQGARTVVFDGLRVAAPLGVFLPRNPSLPVVEAAAALPLPPAPRLLDCGTGTGCILLALLRRLPG
ncbi:unnamed protein product, partial [Prorocentrum cordatum]